MEDLKEFYNDEWKEIRKERFEMDNGECQDCGANAEHCHHLKYPALSVFDCISLCENCHLVRHGKSSWDEY